MKSFLTALCLALAVLGGTALPLQKTVCREVLPSQQKWINQKPW